MNSDTKFILGIGVFTLVIIVLFSYWLTVKGGEQKALVNTPVAGVSVEVPHYDLGEVPINGGLVTKTYQITNTTDRDMELLKIVTSCMCTSANVATSDGETKYFAMEMGGDKNPLISLKLKKGEVANVNVRFDPAAHGPAGVGPFDRVVSLYFDGGIKELTFAGTVVN